MSLVVERTACRVCGGSFDPVLDLGELVLSDFLRPDEPDPPRTPLDLVQCQSCDLVQLRHTVDPERLYRRYWYRSGINEAMRAELQDIVVYACGLVQSPNIVLDIGANDGTLLSFYGNSAFRVAVEPSESVSPRLYAERTFTDFFPAATAEIGRGEVDLITSIACLYDLDDPLAFVAEIDRLLSPSGAWIVQFQDLGQMLAATAYDNLVAEHLCYYSIDTFTRLLRFSSLHITAIERRAINGGSLRFTVRRKMHAPTTSYLSLVMKDRAQTDRDTLRHFAWRVGEHRQQLRQAVEQARAQGYQVDLIGASTKSSTLLQLAGLNASLIRQAVERTTEKVGLETSGTRIPIVSEEDWRVDPAPVSVLGIWQYRSGILQREAEYLARGGAVIVPLPRLEVVYGTSR